MEKLLTKRKVKIFFVLISQGAYSLTGGTTKRKVCGIMFQGKTDKLVNSDGCALIKNT